MRASEAGPRSLGKGREGVDSVEQKRTHPRSNVELIQIYASSPTS